MPHVLESQLLNSEFERWNLGQGRNFPDLRGSVGINCLHHSKVELN